MVTDRAKYGSSTEQRVYCAPAPDFSGYWVLPDVFFPLASGVVNNTLYIIGNGKLYWRTDVQAGTKFSTANIPFTVWSAAVLKDHFYYFTRNGIRRAAAADPFSTQTVFLGVFDNGIQGGGFPKFATAGGTLYLLSDYPLLSIDDGQNWSPWPISADLPWAGKVFSAGNQLFLDNAWVMNSTNGIDFNLWKPQGISELDYLEWQTMVAHKGYLFLSIPLRILLRRYRRSGASFHRPRPKLEPRLSVTQWISGLPLCTRYTPLLCRAAGWRWSDSCSLLRRRRPYLEPLQSRAARRLSMVLPRQAIRPIACRAADCITPTIWAKPGIPPSEHRNLEYILLQGYFGCDRRVFRKSAGQ